MTASSSASGSTSFRRARRRFDVEVLESRTMLSINPIGPEVRANAAPAGEQTTLTAHKAVASNAAGDFVVIWESDQFGPTGLVFGQRFNSAGAKLGGEFVVTPFHHRGQYFPSVAMDASGGFVVVWENRSAPFYGIFSQRYDPQGVAQGGAVQVSTEGAQPVVAMDGDGDYVIAWEQQRPGDRDVVARRYDAAGTALGNPFFVPASNNDFQMEPAIAMDADGQFVVAWSSSIVNVPARRIQGRLFDAAGNPRGGDIDLVPFTPAGIRWGQYRVAMDADGDFALVWDALGWSPDNNGYGVYGRRFSRAGTLVGSEFLVNTTIAGTQNRPDVSMDAAGNMVVVWEGDGLSGMTGQYFGPSNVRVGGEFRVDTPASRGWLASVAMDYDGDFAVGWTSSQGGNNDVYARRFANSVNAPNLVTGQVFHDVSGDGVKNAGDPGSPGWTIYRDVNNDGQLSSSSFTALNRTVFAPIRPVSTRRYLGPAANTTGLWLGQVITDVNLTLNIQHPTDGDLAVWLISPTGRRAELFSRVGGTGDNFSNTTLDDQSPIAINNFPAPFTGTFRTPNQTLGTFNGEVLGDDGYWMLEVQNFGGDTGNMLSGTVTVTYSENSAVSDAAGNYSLSVPFGIHTIREQTRRSWTQTTPPTGAYQVHASSSLTFPDVDFGNTFGGTVSGTIFMDANFNRVFDFGEDRLAGWTVYADLDNNGRLDASDPSTTSTGGGYALRGVPVGSAVTIAAIPPQTGGTPWTIAAAPGPVTLPIRDPNATGVNFAAVGGPSSAARVMQVYVSGPGMMTNAAFGAAAGVDANLGYPIPAGPGQTRSLPWLGGVDRFSIRFGEDVYDHVDPDDLQVRTASGAQLFPAYMINSRSSRSATWVLPAPVTRNKLRLFIDDADLPTLDGEWNPAIGSYPSGDGAIGGDFSFRVNILRGDATGDGAVNALDMSDAKRRLGRRPNDGITGAGAYSVFADITMDGAINALDLAGVRQRLNDRINNLPEPTAS